MIVIKYLIGILYILLLNVFIVHYGRLHHFYAFDTEGSTFMETYVYFSLMDCICIPLIFFIIKNLYLDLKEL